MVAGSNRAIWSPLETTVYVAAWSGWRETDDTLYELALIELIINGLSTPARDASPSTFSKGPHEFVGDAALAGDRTDCNSTSLLQQTPVSLALPSISIADQDTRMNRCDVLAPESPYTMHDSLDQYVLPQL